MPWSGGALLAVAVTAIMGFSSSLKLQLAHFEQSLSRPVAQSNVQNQPAILHNSTLGGDEPPTIGMPNATLPASNKQWSNLTGDPKQAAMAIQTVGANGTTEELATTLQEQVLQMISKGEITEDEANGLLKLANQGHQLAQAQKLLEDSIVQGKTSIIYEGKTYSIKSFGDSIGFNIRGGNEVLENFPPEHANSTLKPFADQLQAVKQSGALDNPAVQAKVSKIVFQIAFITDTLRWTAMDTIAAGYAPGQGDEKLKQSTVEHYLMNLGDPNVTVETINAALKTHANSTQICTTGSGNDNGLICRP